MKLILFIIVSIVSLISYGQTEELLIGEWKLEKISGLEEMEADKADMLNQMFADMAFTFESKENYTATVMGNVEKGKWSIKKKGTIMYFINTKNQESEFTIVNLTETHLTINMGRSESYVLVKQ